MLYIYAHKNDYCISDFRFSLIHTVRTHTHTHTSLHSPTESDESIIHYVIDSVLYRNMITESLRSSNIFTPRQHVYATTLEFGIHLRGVILANDIPLGPTCPRCWSGSMIAGSFISQSISCTHLLRMEHNAIGSVLSENNRRFMLFAVLPKHIFVCGLIERCFVVNCFGETFTRRHHGCFAQPS